MFDVGDVVWYKTGIFSASRVKIVGIQGSGGALSYIVHFVDHSPEQSNASDVNVDRWDHCENGCPVSAKKCVALTDIEKRIYEMQMQMMNDRNIVPGAGGLDWPLVAN